VIRYERFQLALERLGYDSWALFERLCSQFLASEYATIRTMASASGDAGRDSELFSSDGEPTIVFQYSVSSDWSGKIHNTLKRLRQTFPHIQVLVYMSNQEIGAKADRLKKEVRESSIILDVRDKSWFLERLNTDDCRQIAAEELAKKMVDPLLAERSIIRSAGKVFDSEELSSVYLLVSFQMADETREKGLTKVAFEAIVRSVLRATNSENRLSRRQIKNEVVKMLPSHSTQQIEQFVDSALKRMTKTVVRHWQKEDAFCLAYEEMQRLSVNVALYDKRHKELLCEIRGIVSGGIPQSQDSQASLIDGVTVRVSEIIEQYLSSRGEHFASTVSKGDTPSLAMDDLRSIIQTNLNHSPLRIKSLNANDFVFEVICSLFQSPSDSTRSFLRMASDSYTLMAFLQETPDVQKCVKKIFSSADIWLDTTVVLPLFAELLIEDESRRQYSSMMGAARASGVKLFVIPGVLEELSGHMNRCLACVRQSFQSWEGDIPFLLSLFVSSGRGIGSFPSWIEQFRGDVHPEEDLADYLSDFMGIGTRSLESEASKVTDVIRYAVQEVWREAHMHRKDRKGYRIDDLTVDKLIRHDEESYVGILGLRSNQDRQDVGYTSWWLTLDSAAYRMQNQVQNRTNQRIDHSPVMSLDYLASNLCFGPLRSHQEGKSWVLPIFLDWNFWFNVPGELMALAQQVRDECAGLPENVVQRRVRDRLDDERKRIGLQAQGGNRLIQDTIESAFEDL
jgi:hypothetical protein